MIERLIITTGSKSSRVYGLALASPERLVEAHRGSRMEHYGDVVRQACVVRLTDAEAWLHQVSGDRLHFVDDVRVLLSHEVEQLRVNGIIIKQASYSFESPARKLVK